MFRRSGVQVFRGAAARALAIALLAAGLAVAPADAAPGSVMLADGRVLDRVTLRPGASPDRVLLERLGAEPLTLPTQDLLVVDFGKNPTRPLLPTVRLANGDQVIGKLSFPTARQVKISAGWGALTVPLTWCAAVRVAEKAPVPEPVRRDTLLLANDRVEGEIQGIANGRISIDVGGNLLPVDLARVQALALAPRERKPEGGAGLLLALDLGGGEKLTGRWVKLDPDILTIRTDWGDTVDIPVASLSRLEVKNGRLVYLSDLKPAEARQVPYIDGAFPHRADQSVSGRPIRLRGRAYSRGLGVHSRSELTYSLDGRYQTFAATAGIDDAVAGQGSVVFRVFGDEKLLFESPVVRGGDAPLEIKLDVGRVLLLRLEVDYADNGDAADHADWAEARLLRQ